MSDAKAHAAVPRFSAPSLVEVRAHPAARQSGPGWKQPVAEVGAHPSPNAHEAPSVAARRTEPSRHRLTPEVAA
ncbi:hypothetical protein [Streptomyces sp. MAR4 CNX-425]|uniref:hypothetical protein n=1 Tax=Streptomyces sp. MAR4 CNX-425 TaxID=3406343 RepID=UPI003B501021